ncbi:hypothetical protein [Thermovirga lienii]|uniref:hypothetical protein n=1 Tax=Thermovirga lienii TaxID=336261 RepID=UPI000ED565BE|nr:hypothetical protein [Thermovirga sp.]MDN5368564.1 hypothetical protein [Thermovirga sp.]HCD71783.1 hypothetical protein [Thermovirga lienii]
MVKLRKNGRKLKILAILIGAMVFALSQGEGLAQSVSLIAENALVFEEQGMDVETVGVTLKELFFNPPRILAEDKKYYLWDPKITKFLSSEGKALTPNEFAERFKGKSIAIVIHKGLVLKAYSVDF